MSHSTKKSQFCGGDHGHLLKLTPANETRRTAGLLPGRTSKLGCQTSLLGNSIHQIINGLCMISSGLKRRTLCLLICRVSLQYARGVSYRLNSADHPLPAVAPDKCPGKSQNESQHDDSRNPRSRAATNPPQFVVRTALRADARDGPRRRLADLPRRTRRRRSRKTRTRDEPSLSRRNRSRQPIPLRERSEALYSMSIRA